MWVGLVWFGFGFGFGLVWVLLTSAFHARSRGLGGQSDCARKE